MEPFLLKTLDYDLHDYATVAEEGDKAADEFQLTKPNKSYTKSFL